MKKTFLLNAPLSRIIAMQGHGDGLCIADAGLPIPGDSNAPERIDLAVSRGIPSFLEVLNAVLSELNVEHFILAEKIKINNPEIHNAILSQLEKISVTYISHEKFKQRTHKTKAIIRCGECTPYANIILQSGVVFT